MNSNLQHDSDDNFLEFARNTLEQSLLDMDAATSLRLARARARALTGKRGRNMRWLPAGIAVTITAATAGLIMMLHPGPAGVFQPPEPDDMELLSSDVDLETLSDMDFYTWLEKERNAG